MAGIQGARKLLFFRDSHVDQDPSHQGDCLLHAAAVSFSHLLVDPLAADAAGFFIGQFGVSRSKIGIAERNVIVTPWSGCDE